VIRVLLVPSNKIRGFGHVGWGNSTWGGQARVFGTDPVCVRVQEMAGGRWLGGEGRVLAGMVVKGALFRQE
nr:hypothetical protein [Tanacetum cinerariifolium]